MLAFREGVKQATGLPKKVEFHSSELIRPHKLDVYKQLHKSVRVRLLKDFAGLMPTFFPTAHILSVCLDKQQLTTETNYQEMAWQLLLRGFDAFLQSQKSTGAGGIRRHQ